MDNGDGTVTDLKTNLMWLRSPKELPVTYDEAVDYCKNLSYNNLSGWRLPTVMEWLSIMEQKQIPPSLISGYPFDKPIFYSHLYWTKTQSEFSINRFYTVDLYKGYTGPQNKEFECMVWPVRDNE